MRPVTTHHTPAQAPSVQVWAADPPGPHGVPTTYIVAYAHPNPLAPTQTIRVHVGLKIHWKRRAVYD